MWFASVSNDSTNPKKMNKLNCYRGCGGLQKQWKVKLREGAIVSLYIILLFLVGLPPAPSSRSIYWGIVGYWKR